MRRGEKEENRGEGRRYKEKGRGIYTCRGKQREDRVKEANSGRQRVVCRSLVI